jgi:hypothetical protein
MTVEGYIVCPGLIKNEDGIYDFYMNKRQELFGFTQMPPTLSVPLGSRIELCSGPPGLVKTRDQAEQLLATLKMRFPNWHFVIREWADLTAIEIDWHQVRFVTV